MKDVNQKGINVNDNGIVTVEGDVNLNVIDKSIDNRVINTIIINTTNSYNLHPDELPFRTMLLQILDATRNPIQQFSCFVKNVYNEKHYNHAVINNVFWNNVYVCNHVNIKYSKDIDLKVGDFILIEGKIDPYDKPRKKNKTYDIGIEDIKLIKKIYTNNKFGNISGTPEKFDKEYITRLSIPEQKEFINIQYRRITRNIEPCYDKIAEMYKSILLNVYYLERREQEMITNRLDINCEWDEYPDICIWSAFIRYIICEKHVDDPCTIYLILSKVLGKTRNLLEEPVTKEEEKLINQNIKQININLGSNFSKQLLIDSSQYIRNYIEEFKQINGDI